jgi:hypothetical protein
MMINYVSNKNYGAIVSDLNPQSENEGFESSHLQYKIT